MKQLLSIIILLFIAVVFTGCASVPMATKAQDETAKQFNVPKGKSNIYLYRNETLGGAITMVVSLDGVVKGKTSANSYFLWTVDPGKHTVASHTEDTKTININAAEGKNYFVWQEVKMGMWTANSALHEVSESEGRNGVLECDLIKAK